jgi:hypothetical protein
MNRCLLKEVQVYLQSAPEKYDGMNGMLHDVEGKLLLKSNDGIYNN